MGIFSHARMSLYIYSATNKINGKRYIGKTKFDPPTHRWNQHLAAAKKGPKDNKRFQPYFHRAIRKHGRDNFSFDIIATFDDKDVDAWMQAEKKYIKQYRSNERDHGYNLTDGGDGVPGWKASRAARRRMSEAKMGVFEGEKNPFYGKRHSARVRKLLSEKAAKRTGRRNPFHGRRHSSESRAKMAENHYDKECYLSVEQVEEARRLYSTSQFTVAQLAERFDVTPYVAEKAICGLGAYAKIGRQLPRRENGWIKATRPTPRLLTDDEVAAFRRRHRKGEDLTTLAKERGVSITLISSAVRGHAPYDRVQCDEPPIAAPEISGPLADDKVDEARQLYASGKYTYDQLAKTFRVSKAVAQNAVRGKGRYGKIGKPLQARFGRWAKNERRAANER